MRIKSFIVLCFLIFLSACKKDKNSSPVQLHTDYSPIEEGRYVIYESTEITHDAAVNQHDTLTFLLKTKIGSIYVDNEGRAAREFLRFISLDTGLTWQLSDTWTTILDGNKLELVEENQRVVKLLFAPTIDKVWDINAYNSFPKQNASYSSIHTPRSINGNNFDSTITVKQADFFSLVDYQKQNEVYAKGVGMVSKYFKDLIIANFDTLNVLKGKELYYNCISFGLE